MKSLKFLSLVIAGLVVVYFLASEVFNIFGLNALFISIALLFMTGLFILFVMALLDILKNEFTGNNKLIWIIAVIFVPLIGVILYFVVGKNQKITQKTPPRNTLE